MSFVRFFSTSVRHSTKAWMARHVSDPYVRRSVKENYRARSAFKLIEINNTYQFIQPGHTVIDMGAAPGAWSQVLVKLVNARVSPGKKIRKGADEESIHPSEITTFHQPNPDLRCGTVIALDRDPIFAIPGVHIIDDWNLTEENTVHCHQRLKDLLTRLKLDQVDGILSDMCPNVTGCKAIDHAAIVVLQQRAFNFARELLKPNGYFLCKLFQGQESFEEMRGSLQSFFQTVHLIKPSASRSESSETYLLARQYHGSSSKQSSKNIHDRDKHEMEELLAEARRIISMVLRRHLRDFSDMNDQMSFFEPVYSNGHVDLLADGIPRPAMENDNRKESNPRADIEIVLEEPSDLISSAKLRIRINQIENSMEQAETMLNSMEQFQHILPGTDQQRNKLQSILCNLEEQKTSYMNLLDLVSLAEQERSTIINGNISDHTDDEDNLSLRRHSQLPIVRPRIESKIGFIRPLSTPPIEMHYSDIEPTIRNRDSLVGSLTWKDHQSTTDEELSDDELEKHLILQNEQCRAVQGQKPTNDERNLLWDINHLRDRLKVIRNIYERKHRDELEKLQNSAIPTESRLKNLEHVRERLDELEQLVTYYQTNDELPTYTNAPEHLDQLSTELTAKRLELEHAKSALNQLQQMVKSIQPEESSSSVRSTPIPRRSPLNHSIDTPRSVDAKMVAQHREIERLVESRQRLSNIHDHIASLHETMRTPISGSNNYEENLNDSRNLRPIYPEDNASEFDDDLCNKPRLKQSNCYASDTVVGGSYEDLNSQMREICRCLSTFIEEQKSFNRHIEQHLTTAVNPTTDPMMNQLQQQVVTQGLIVNLNTAYREIAVLQSEINTLQSQNTRLISSVSLDQQYHPHHAYGHSSRSSIDSQSTGKQTAIHVETTPIPRSTHPRQSSKENLFTSFVIHRRHASKDSDEMKHPASATQVETNSVHLTKIEVQTIDLQVKSIMVQLIPYLRLHIDEGFNQGNLNDLRERILFLFKQQPDSSRLIDRFHHQFSHLLDKTIEKYCGTTIHECVADLIHDLSNATFDELVTYKIYQNNHMNLHLQENEY